LLIKDFVKDWLLRHGYIMQRSTTDEQIHTLIRGLRPKNCGAELIRLGGSNDGGYLVPDDLEGVEYCFSPGVNTIANFESDLADRGIHSFMADYSVDAPPLVRPEFTFDKKFLGCTDDGQFWTLATWKEKYLSGYQGDMILQMDIEGAEYDVLINTPDHLLQQFRVIAIEFHELDNLFDPFFFRMFETVLRKLDRHFHVVHLHPNNSLPPIRKGKIEIPALIEVTFYNRRRVSTISDAVTIPHPLDQDNTNDAPPLPLPKHWLAA
jgi:hypothetical protein